MAFLVLFYITCCPASRKIRQAGTNMKKDSGAIKNPRQQILYLPPLKPLAILTAPPLLYLFQQSEGSYQN